MGRHVKRSAWAGGVLVCVLVAAGCGPSGGGAPTADADATLAYWNNFAAIAARATPAYRALERTENRQGQPTEKGLRTAADATRQMAIDAAALPVRGVDADAIAYAGQRIALWNDVSVWLDSTASLNADAAALAKHADSTEALVEAFLRGLNGDPLGKVNEMMGAEAQISREAQALEAQLHDFVARHGKNIEAEMALRATLTRRYDRDFVAMPALR